MSVTINLIPDPDLPATLLADAAIAEMALGLGIWINKPHDGPAASYGQGSYTVRAIARGAPIPAADEHHWPVHLTMHSDAPGAAGYHDVADGAPMARIFVADILAAGMVVSAVISHELVEMLVDRWLTGLVAATVDGQDRAYMKEAADPCERFGTLFAYGNGQHIEVSEFVRKPYWLEGNDGPYSSLGNCPGPLTPALGGRQAFAPLGQWAESQAAPLVPEAAPATRRHISALHDVIRIGRNTPAAP